MAGGASAVVVEKLSKQYAGPPAVDAVKGIDLEVARGEIFGLLGPNGAGKTTTVGMCTTRVVPTSGRVAVDGIDVQRDPPGARGRIGVVTQFNTLDRSCTVFENLKYHCRYFGMSHRDAKVRSTELLETFRLADRADANVMALSGGMAQRLQVARSIAHRPVVLFLDEPTSGLDPQSRIALWEVLGALHDEGTTVILTTHYMEEADQLCGRVAIMDHGRILALDTPDGLKRSVGVDTIVTVKASGDQERLSATLTAALDGVTRARPTDHGLELHVRGSDRLLARTVAAAEDAGFAVEDLSMSEPSL
jgi:ABC-2 type transport system ATP-binding protein